jgi:hypothetical protein
MDTEEKLDPNHYCGNPDCPGDWCKEEGGISKEQLAAICRPRNTIIVYKRARLREFEIRAYAQLKALQTAIPHEKFKIKWIESPYIPGDGTWIRDSFCILHRVGFLNWKEVDVEKTLEMDKT